MLLLHFLLINENIREETITGSTVQAENDYCLDEIKKKIFLAPDCLSNDIISRDFTDYAIKLHITINAKCLKGFPPLLPLHGVTPTIKAILKMIKMRCFRDKWSCYREVRDWTQKAVQPGFTQGDVWFGMQHLDCCIWAREHIFCTGTWEND